MTETPSRPTNRQLRPWPWWRRLLREAWVYPLDLDDGTGDGSPSLAKMLALFFAIVTGIAILREIPISGTAVLAMTLVLSAAFGRAMYKAYLSRGSWSQTTTDTTTRVDQRIRQEIVERRAQGAEDGTEPTA